MDSTPLAKRSRLDPRLWQIAVLAGLLIYGVGRLDFEIAPRRVVLLLVSALLAQFLCGRLTRTVAFEPRSALISGLSLCLLLRTPSDLLAMATAVIAIGSKFAIRVRGKHVFNPTNVGLVAMMAAGADVWVSPGQWGNAALLAFLFACLGGLVVNRAARSDVTWSFLVFHLAFTFGWAAWLGQPLATPLHKLANGALLLFSFFMISDPRTTPDSRAGRILFAFLVALGAWVVTTQMYRTNGLLWSLAALSLAVPAIDRWLPGARYRWERPATGARPRGEPDETHVRGLAAAGRARAVAAARP